MQHVGHDCDRRWTSRLFALGTALLLLVATGGCNSLGLQAHETQFSDPVTFNTIRGGSVNVGQIDKGQYGSIVEGTQRVLRDEEAYASFWEKLHADRSSTPERPEVDFGNRVVIAVVMGKRSTGGYSVGVDEVLRSEDDNQIQVQFTEKVPGEGCPVTQVLTSPYVLATVAAQDEEVTFDGAEETRPC